MDEFEHLARQNTYVGRMEQQALLREITSRIVTKPHCQVLYFEAPGGLGKTRLLEYYPALVQVEHPELRICPIVDLYSFENRDPAEIEHKLVLGLVPAPNHLGSMSGRLVAAMFADHERYLDGDISIDRLTQTFVRCWNRLATEAPVVIRFDTVESLFVQRAPREALANAAKGRSGAAMILDWLTFVLPLLKHTLVLFAGRPIEPNPVIAQLRELNLLAADVQPLQPLDTSEEIRTYLSKRGERLDPQEIHLIQRVTEGRPLLLTCYAEGHGMWSAARELPRTRMEFEDLLVDTILNPLDQDSSARRTVAYALYFLSYARRGLSHADLSTLFDKLGLECDDRGLEELGKLVLVKRVHASPLIGTSADQDTKGNVRLFLHDEIYQLIDESGKPDLLGLSEPTLSYLCLASGDRVRRAQDRSTSLLAMCDHIYYELTRDFAVGYAYYDDYLDWLLSVRWIPEALILSDAFWGTLTIRTMRGGQESFPYLIQLDGLASTGLDYQRICRDELVRSIELLRASGLIPEAIQRAEALYERFVSEGVLSSRTAADTPEPHPYLFINLSLRWVTALIQGKPSGYEKQAEERFDAMLALLNSPDRLNPRLSQRRAFFMSRVLGQRGYLRRHQQRLFEARHDLELGRQAFHAFRHQQRSFRAPADEPLSDRDLVQFAAMTNNLAFVLAELGDLDDALVLSEMVLDRYVLSVPDYHQALFYNTNALIHLRRGGEAEAVSSIEHALKSQTRSRNQRARGLVLQTYCVMERWRMCSAQIPKPDLKEFYEEAARLLRDEPDQLVEVYAEYARYARNMAQIYQDQGHHVDAETYRNQACKILDTAIIRGSELPCVRRANLFESRAASAVALGHFDEALTWLKTAEDELTGALPPYAQVVSGKIMLQRGLLAVRAGEYPQALCAMAIALARAFVFGQQHRDQRAFIRVIDNVLPNIPAVERQQFSVQTRTGDVYVPADSLNSIPPEPVRWVVSWERSVRHLNHRIAVMD